MSEFNPPPREQITIGGLRYEVMPHPAVETFAFGQEGRKAFVYQIAGLDDGRLYALKKFKLAYRVPELVDICDALAPFATIQGLEVCRRQCLNARRYKDILTIYPDLEFAMLMPWIDGSTWYDVVVGMKPLNKARAATLAWSTATVLAKLEEAGLAHCDLSSGNVIINLDSGNAHLIDVEDMYAPDFAPPGALPAGSDGYAHHTAAGGLWEPDADRFAGAVLMAEMLAWHDPTIRQEAEDEHYFAVSEMQQDSPRYRLMSDVLWQLDERLAELFDQAWRSSRLSDCPPMYAWREVIEELYRQARVADVAPEWRPIVLGSGVDYQAPPVDSVPSRERLPASPIESETPAHESMPIEAPPVESTPVHYDNPTDAPQPSQGGPLIGFRPLVMPPSQGSDEPPTEASSRAIETPEPPEPAFDALEMDSTEGVISAEAVSNGSSDEATWPGTPAETVEPQWVGEESDEVGVVFNEDGEEALVTTRESTEEAGAPAKMGLLARLKKPFSRQGRKTAERKPPAITRMTPQLDLIGVDDDGRPILAWKEAPGADHYELQEAQDVDFTEPRTTRIRQGMQWQPRRSRYGTFFYRVRAVAEGDAASAWSNVVRVRIMEE